MFNHKNFALHGLFPGLVSTRSVANLGHFEIYVIITPVQPSGGGWVPMPLGSVSDKYTIRIRVRHKSKTWEYEKTVGTALARVAAKVIGKTLVEPSVKIVNTSMVENVTPTIKVTIK